MRYLLILIPCFLLAHFQGGQTKKPSLPPLPEAEVPSPPGVTPDKGTPQPKTPGKGKEPTASQPSPVEGAPKGPAPRPGIGKIQRSLMGVWRVLPSASLGGNTRKSVKGYLIITKAHLSFQLMVDVRGDKGSFQTGVRTYAILGNQLITSSLQGIRNAKEPGKILLDPVGLRETRKFALTAPNVLRLIQPKGQILEFQRVEQL